jgi:bacterial/archaeal transporter family-2 protein
VLRIFDLIAFMALAAGAGVSFVMQQAVNANLRATIGSAAWAGFVSYLGGTLCMLVVAFAMRDALPSTGAVTQTNWWAWSGGLFGAIYIAVSILLMPRLGAATFISLLIAGQMLASLVFDHFGLFGVPQHSADFSRLLGAVLLIGGVVLVRL